LRQGLCHKAVTKTGLDCTLKCHTAKPGKIDVYVNVKSAHAGLIDDST